MNSFIWIHLWVLLVLAGVAQASDEDPLCFNFKTPVTQALVKKIASPGRKDATAGEKFQDEKWGEWGAARGQVAKPLIDVYHAVLDPYTIKDPDKAKVKLTQENRPGFKAFQTREIKISPFPLINIEWVEHWAFVQTEGKPSDPKEIVVSYQKVEGTSHIRRFCGSIVLRAMGKKMTDVFLYERVKSSRRDAKDIIDGHLGTLRTLRKVAAEPMPVKSGSPD